MLVCAVLRRRTLAVDRAALLARLRQVVADALQPMQQALARLETMAAAPSPPDGGSSVRLLQERARQCGGR